MAPGYRHFLLDLGQGGFVEEDTLPTEFDILHPLGRGQKVQIPRPGPTISIMDEQRVLFHLIQKLRGSPLYPGWFR